MRRTNHPVIVIGGGAAGIIAAWRAAALGASVILLERNKKPGIKILISGGGKCNITHAGPMEELRAAFRLNEARFLKPCFHQFTNIDICRLLHDRGVKTSARPNGRVFPVSNNADDVLAAVLTALREQNVQVNLNSRVEKLLFGDGRIVGAVVNGEVIPASHTIVATGGVSYSKTGTTGDGIRWLRDLGHTVVPLRAALAPIRVTPLMPADWRGVAIRGGSLAVYNRARKLFEWKDDILFTHEGISGPAALEVSRYAAEALDDGAAHLKFDFFPDRDFTLLDNELNDLILKNRGKMIGTILEAWLPNRIVPRILESLNINLEKRGHVLTREERRSITNLLKSWEMGRVAKIEIDRGEVTAGGIALTEVDPKTMRSRKIKGLYICGEMLDIAGPVGGYNLQAAFSTGYVAGETAGRDWLTAEP